MEKDLTLSERVQSFIDSEDFLTYSDVPMQEREEAKKNRRFVELVVEAVVQSRETITDAKLKAVETLVQAAPELISDFLDDYFTRQVVSEVQGYVSRLLKLSRLDAEQLPSQVTNGYLSEAVRTYILGLPQASIALCRAALEQALKDRLGHQLSGSFITWQELLKEARKWNLLDEATEAMAREVANAADEVLHEKPADWNKAEEVVLNVRGLIQQIYSTEGSF